MKLFNLFKRKKSLLPHYDNYPEKPFISPDRDIKAWLEEATLFSETSFVKREMMLRNEDGLLPGHVYMLQWLKKFSKHTNKKYPLYFEYLYGISFEKELLFLREEKFIENDNEITNSGNRIIEKHYSVIENHDDPTGEKRCLANLINSKLYKDPGSYDPFQLYRIGNELYKQNEYIEAEKYLLASVKKGNYAPALYNRLSILYRKLKRYQDEINILKLSIKVMQDMTGIYQDDAYDRINERINKATTLLLKQQSE